MKTKSKLLRIIIGLLLLFSIQKNAFAVVDKSYNIKKIDIKLTIPSNLIVFTQDTSPDDTSFSNFGLDGYSLIESFKNSNIYLNAISNDDFYEIVVTMLEYDGSKKISDFRRYNAYELRSFAKDMDSLAADYKNITFLNYELYEHSQAKFIVFNIKQPDGYCGTAYGKQYFTIIGGRAINITLHSYNEAISTTQNNLIEEVVDSIEFGASYKKTVNTSSSLFSRVLYKVLVGTASGCIITAVITLYCFIKKSAKKASAKKQSQIQPNIEATQSTSFENRIICSSCGATLLSDSVFCDKCGEKVISTDFRETNK